MFHLQMAVLNLLFQYHMGEKSDVSSLAKWFITLERDSNIIGTGKRHTIRDFRACHQLFNHVLDAHVLAIVGTKLGVTSCADLCEALEVRNWQEAFKNTEKELTDLYHIDKRRGLDERDPVYENAILFLQHGLIYRDFCDAMRHGDSGRVKNCLTFFMLWFQGSKFSNYARELIHLVASLNHIWSRDMCLHWYQTVLINFSGSEEGFRPVDLVGEFVVREIKSWQTGTTVTGAGGEYLRNVMAPQVLLCSQIRDLISREIGATEYYKHSSAVSAWFDVRKVADSLLADRVLSFLPGRSIPPRSTVPSDVCDLYLRGVGQIWAGEVIDRYLGKRQAESLEDGLKEGGEDGGTTHDSLEVGIDEGDDDADAIREILEEFL
jgi:hypothetical protein